MKPFTSFQDFHSGYPDPLVKALMNQPLRQEIGEALNDIIVDQLTLAFHQNLRSLNSKEDK